MAVKKVLLKLVETLTDLQLAATPQSVVFCSNSTRWCVHTFNVMWTISLWSMQKFNILSQLKYTKKNHKIG